MTPVSARTKHSVQIQMLKAAVLTLAERDGKAMIFHDKIAVEFTLEGLHFLLWPFGEGISADVFDESCGQVLNMNWVGDRSEVLVFRRGDWEAVLLEAALESCTDGSVVHRRPSTAAPV